MSSGDDTFKLDILAELERLARLFEQHERFGEAEATRQVSNNIRTAEDKSDSNTAS